MDLAEEMETLKKIKAAKMEAMFPDEVDTPLDLVRYHYSKKVIYLQSTSENRISNGLFCPVV
jgi:hypothetical protein